MPGPAQTILLLPRGPTSVRTFSERMSCAEIVYPAELARLSVIWERSATPAEVKAEDEVRDSS